MASQLRKIVIVNTADGGGGAERVSMDVLNGFLQLGLDAWLLVGAKTSDHPRVVSFYTSPFFDYHPYRASPVLRQSEERRREDQRHGFEDFNHPYSHRLLEMTGTAPDLVLCHNLHGGYFDLRALPGLSHRRPVALRLFDSWLQTGHCAYSLGCGRWQSGCGECPDLSIPPAISRDATHANWRRKQRIFQASRLFVSAESQWMIEHAKQSILAPSVVEWNHIPGGVELHVFTPGAREDARRQLGIDPDVQLLLYVAHQGAENRYKDFATVRRALDALRHWPRDRKVELLCLGAEAPDEEIAPYIKLRHAGPVASRPYLALHYQAADLLIHAAVEETFGNVVAEALACGTPVIAASGGGVVELIEPGRTGLIVPPGQPDALAEAVASLLNAPARRHQMGKAAAASARRRFDSQLAIEALHGWCNHVHAAWHIKAAS